MIAAMDYRELAKQKKLEIQIATLNTARTNILTQMKEAGLAISEESLHEGRVDLAQLEQDTRMIRELQEQTYRSMLSQQAVDMIDQAREGSRFVRLERKLARDPECLARVDVSELQEEQIQYQAKQLEIFDYLAKHFAQFASMETSGLPEAGEKFYRQVVRETIDKMETLVKDGRELQRQIAEKSKKMSKLNRREQRELEQIHDETGRGASENGEELVRKNQAYRELLGEIRATKALRTSLLNQTNNLIDQGIEQLRRIGIHLGSIVGQNQTTRELLFGLKTENDTWEVVALQRKIAETLLDFDRQVAQLLVADVGKRFEKVEIAEPERRFWGDLVEEVTQFQEYLGQIMGDSQQVIEGNLADLEDERAKFGRCILDFCSARAIL